MTLDITKVASQVGEMVIKIKSGNAERHEHLKCAVNRLSDQNIDLERLKHKINSARTQHWSPAGLVEGLSLRYPSPPLPHEYTVLATDGSNIDVDRHQSTHCYLINISAVSLHYGAHPCAELDSFPRLYSEDKDLVIRNENNRHQEQMIGGALLDAKRAVEEIRKLAEIAARLPADVVTLALLDGSLVMFGMQNYPEFVVREILDSGLIKVLDALKNLSSTRKMALASYISLPRSDDVVNALRVAICPHETVDCDRNCSSGDSACDIISGVNDRILFSNLLGAGERSALFINPSMIMKRYGVHQVYFFYLRAEDEIARVEVPEWVAMDKRLLDLTHSLVLDQCRRGQGYPVALSEAHEQAVVTGADREEFWQLVEEYLVDEKMPAYTSTKNQSKRTRWI